MRISIISDLAGYSWAGCEELWAATARRALLGGHRVAFLQSREEVAPEKIRPLKELGLELIQPPIGARVTHRIRTRVSWKVGTIASKWFPSFSGLDRLAPDVLFINGGEAIPRPDFLDDLVRSHALISPYVVACHNSYLSQKPLEGAARDAAVRYYQGARRVLFVAKRTRNDTEHLLATKIPSARIVRNPVNMTDTACVPILGGRTVRIASVGRLAINAKGQDILLAALGSSEFKDRDWKLSIYGEGPHTAHLKLLSKHYQISERVAFKGHLADVRAIWANNHLLALPSRNESAPLVLVEAMLCGRPSVSNDVGGVREWVSEPETGFISEGIDIESFQRALERAWSARSDWEAIGQRAHEKALKMLNPDPGLAVLNLLLDAAGERRSGTQPELEGPTMPDVASAKGAPSFRTRGTPSNTLYNDTFYVNQQSASSRSAKCVVPIVLSLCPVINVIDVGCGVGTWAREFLDRGIKDVLGIDGDYVNRDLLKIPQSCFHVCNLSEPIELNRRFELAVCLEVAEHLDQLRAEGFVADLTKLASVILFSAAVPGQGGTHHVNEQYLSYWAALFEAKGYTMLDVLRPRIWNDPKCDWTYRQNAVLFVERGNHLVPDNQVLSGVDYIHPFHYSEILEKLNNPTIGYISRSLPGAVKRSLKVRWGRVFAR
jgi:glycosyltransferase involved in cell wall biosynthesis